MLIILNLNKKNQLLGIFIDEMYHKFRGDEQKNK